MSETFYITRETHMLPRRGGFLFCTPQVDSRQRSKRSKPTYYARLDGYAADDHGRNILCWGQSLRRVKVAAKREIARRADCRAHGLNPDERDD